MTFKEGKIISHEYYNGNNYEKITGILLLDSQYLRSWHPVTGEDLICYYKNDKPFNGRQFYESVYSEFLNGIIIGIYEVYSNQGKLRTSGIYKNGKPYEGSFLDKKDKVTYYQNGELAEEVNGLQTKPIAWEGFGRFNVVNYLKEGKADFFIVPNSGKDTLFYSGFYKEGRPWSGTIFYSKYDEYNYIQLYICEYEEGKKNGKETRYLKSFYHPVKFEYNYINGSLEGIATARIKEKKLSTIYKDGKIIKGFGLPVCPGNICFLYKVCSQNHYH
jgi:hypothetical protein